MTSYKRTLTKGYLVEASYTSKVHCSCIQEEENEIIHMKVGLDPANKEMKVKVKIKLLKHTLITFNQQYS